MPHLNFYRASGSQSGPSRKPRQRLFRTKLAFEPLEDRRMLSVFYDFDVIAQTGQDGITDIQPAASINDDGSVAFVATAAGSEDIYFYNAASSSLDRVSPGTSMTYGRELQLNNNNQIGAVSVSGGQRRARIWDANSPGSLGEIIASSSVPRLDSSHFDGLGNFVSMTNDGQLAFAGLENPVSSSNAWWEIHLSDSFVDRRDTLSPFSEVTDFVIPPSVFFRFQAADGDRAVVGSRTSTAKRIIWYDITGVDTVEGIASTASGNWSDLGVRPGISDDGQIVAFYGDLTSQGALTYGVTAGPGIFAAIDDDGILSTAPKLVRIAGVLGNNLKDPGERREVAPPHTDLGPDFNFDGVTDWGYSLFAADVAVSVTSLQPFADPTKGSYATVVFLANDSVNLQAQAIYASRVNFFNDLSGNIANVGVEAPIQVVRTGETVAGFGSITALGVHDAVNSSGTITFHAASSGEEAIFAATLDYRDMLNGRSRFDPDSPLVEYVVQGRTLNNRANGTDDINQIVLHATVGDLEASLPKLSNGTPYLGVHYLVTREGAVVQLVPEVNWASHAMNVRSDGDRHLTNKHSIGIELIDDGPPPTGHTEDPAWFTDEQARKTALLVRDIGVRNSVPLEHLLPFPLATTRGAERKTTETDDRFKKPDVSLTGPPVSTDPNGFNILGFGEVDAIAGWKEGTTVSGSQWIADGFDYTAEGILAHGQVVDRTPGKTDPHAKYFDWSRFMARVQQPLAFQLNSPANLFLVDPLGRRVGFDPASGLVVNEIPGAIFSGAGTEPQILVIPDPIDGDYDVQVVGTGSGPFRLDVLASDDESGLMSTSIVGDTIPGQVNEITIPYSNADVQSSLVQSIDNLRPVANDDIASTVELSPIVIDVLLNDSDADGSLDIASVSISSPPSNGVVGVDTLEGTVTYTPNAGFLGTDQFTYFVNDDIGAVSTEGGVTVVVRPDTVPPFAENDSAFTESGVPTTIPVLDNDNDPDGTIDPSTLDVAAPPEFGVVTVDHGTNEFVYAPNVGFFGADSFVYVVNDERGVTSNEATVTIEVTAAPVPEADLAIVKSDSADPVLVGDNITYTLSVTNNGPDTAENVVLSDTLPAGVIFVSAGVDQGTFGESGGVVTYDIGDIASGGTVSATVVITTTAAGTLTNIAEVSSDTDDPDLSNNTVAEQTTVNPVNDPPEVVDVRARWGSHSASILSRNVLPWSNIGAIDIVFSEDVVVQQADLALIGQLSGIVSVTSFTYDSATKTATWAFSPLAVDRFMLELDGDDITSDANDGVTDIFGLYLEGGDYSQSFGVLPGDYNGDGAVTILDVLGIRNLIFAATYDMWADLDGDDDVDMADMSAAFLLIGTVLPR